MSESRTVLSLASILSFRMLGLFMIYPIFALYAPHFHYANPTLIGIALGIYGLTQSLLQLPLSILSDRIGRRPVIFGGLLIFALGSIVSALTQNIYILIIGRALQGSGAIGSTLMAYAADLTKPQNRTKAMAFLGMTIGLSFALAIVFGPLINEWFHLSGIFWLTTIFALSGILIQHFLIPKTDKVAVLSMKESVTTTLKSLLKQTELLKLNTSIFILHALLTASFVVFPILFAQMGFSSGDQWKIYLPLLIIAFALTLPILIFSEQRKMTTAAILSSIALISTAEFLFFFFPMNNLGIIIASLIFFTGFTLLEAILPSLISKLAPPHQKGTAMGIYSTFQFLGIFVGGALAGMIRNHFDNSVLFFCCFSLSVLWFAYISFLNSFKKFRNQPRTAPNL